MPKKIGIFLYKRNKMDKGFEIADAFDGFLSKRDGKKPTKSQEKALKEVGENENWILCKLRSLKTKGL